jgi:PAS domain S-box-containing protein
VEIEGIMKIQRATHGHRRALGFCVVGIGLVAAYGALRGVPWRGDAWIHTIMETAATLLAAFIGALALLRYYTLRENTVLFVGAGFLGTAFLDGYHAVVTSVFFRPYMPSDLPSLIPWSWVASRQFLSIFLFLSWLAWLREHRRGEAGRIRPGWVYLFTATFTLASFLFFAFVPLPRAYYPEFIFQRPEEFGPALFFLLALIGYLHQGKWRHDASAYWMVMALIVSFVGQASYMSLSGQLFDLEFDIAHLLKKLSYICVLTGLLVSMYGVFKQAETSEHRTRAILETVPEGILTIDAAGTVQGINPGAQKIFGYDAAEAIGRNVNMLMPESARGEHDGYIANYLNTNEAKIIGIGREVTGLRKNGQSFPLTLSVGEFSFDDNRGFVGVVRDITELKKIERMKNEFISTVSHELRTPLTSIVGSLGLVRNGAAGALPEKALAMIDIAYNNSDRLVRLINDMLDIEKTSRAA